MLKYYNFICIALLLLITVRAEARTATESELLAASQIGEDITHWLSALKQKPKSMAIVFVNYLD